MAFTKKVFPNGARLLMEPFKGVRSASVGVWIETGSREERPGEEGISHFIEHMLFKGSARYDAFELNDAMNRLGGHFNAFTTQESICLHARLIDEQVGEGLDLLGEVLLASTYPAEELERERNVILEEVKMIEDTPDDLVIDLFHEAMWGEDPVGRPIIGRPETIRRFRREDFLAFIQREFSPERMIVTVAGAFDKRAIEEQVRQLFSAFEPQPSRTREIRAPQGVYLRQKRAKDIEQVQFCFGSLAPSRAHEDRYRFALLNSVLGGGMSSRIFREVREKRGLAYSIGTYVSSFRDTGAFAVAGGTSPETLEKVIDLSRKEIRSIYRKGVSEAELLLAKQQLRASILFSLESTGSRMSQLADQEMYLGRYVKIDETLKAIDEVTTSQVQETAEQWLKNARVAVALVGPEGPAGEVKKF